MSFNTISENKILTKSSEFTVYRRIVGWSTLLALLLSCDSMCSLLCCGGLACGLKLRSFLVVTWFHHMIGHICAFLTMFVFEQSKI